MGVLSLAKDFGKQTVYHLRRRSEAEGQVFAAPPEEMEEEAVSVPEAGITERPAPGVESVLATVARMIERADNGGAPKKGRKKKATKPVGTEDPPTPLPEITFAEGDEHLWPGA